MTNLQKITQSYQRHNLLILWAETPFPLAPHTPKQPAQVISRWQSIAAQLPPLNMPLWALPPLPILSLDPTTRWESAFATAGASLRAVVTRQDVPSRGQHSLFKLAGDLPSRRAVIASRSGIAGLMENPDKRYLLMEVRRILGEQGALLMINADTANEDFQAWWRVLSPALGSPPVFASAGAAIAGISALDVDFDTLTAELRQIYRQKSQEKKIMTDPESLKKQLDLHHRRLGKLKEQAALFGANTSPEILLEIEDIESKIAKLTGQIAPPPAGTTIIVQGDGNVIATAGGIAVGGDIKGDVSAPENDEPENRK